MGDISLSDLAAISRLQGQEGLPYPFGHTHPRIEDERGSAVAGRLDHGDLKAFRESTDAYVAAEIWVTCRVHRATDGTLDRRILAYRAGDAGYLACQRGNDDVIEVSRLSALDLGAAIAGAAGLSEPGKQPRIVIPGYIGYFAHRAASEYDDSDDDEGYSVRVSTQRSSQSAYQVVADDEVAAVATIQSRWQPAREWGVDWTKNFIACTKIDADGDYIYAPDFSHAVPLAEQFLSERIDMLIAEDIAALRLQRGCGP